MGWRTPRAPPASQAREAATSRQSVETKGGGEAATLPRHHRDDAETASACVGVPAAPSDRVSAGSALARAPPAAA